MTPTPCKCAVHSGREWVGAVSVAEIHGQVMELEYVGGSGESCCDVGEADVDCKTGLGVSGERDGGGDGVGMACGWQGPWLGLGVVEDVVAAGWGLGNWAALGGDLQ